MPDTYTPILGLVKPEVGASRDTWGTKWNQNADVLDRFVNQAMPIGAMMAFGGPNAPSGWLICDGRNVSRTTYAKLFAAIGTYWGAGDGSTTFTLPSTNGRALIGPGSGTDANGTGYTFNFTQKAGLVTVVIAQVNLPNLNLTTVAAGAHVHNVWTGGAGGHSHTTDAQGSHAHGGGTTTESANHTHTGYTDVQGNHYHSTPMGYGYMSNPGSHTLVGAAGSNDNQSFTTGWAGDHQHNITTYGESNTHTHQINADGNHAHTTTYIGDHTHGAAMDSQGSHTHTLALGGSGQGMPILQPVLVATMIIFAGSDATVTVEGTVVSLMDAMDETSELALIRQELAELRAILAPPRPTRLLQSPSRGPH